MLALGGIENARVMLASNGEHPEGIGNSSGRVGWFLEHPHYYRSNAILWRHAPDLRFYERHPVDFVGDGVEPSVDVTGAIALSAEVRAAERLPSFTATIESAPMETFDTGNIAPASAAAPFGREASDTSLVALTYRCEQTVTEQSRITLNEKVDALGMPRVDLHWSIRAEDDAALRTSFGLMARELGRLGLGRLWAPQLEKDFVWRPQIGCHHLGTTRMSASSAAGVVDSNLRAHDVDNLYIAGSSVFPTGGDSNPTLTIVALGSSSGGALEGDALSGPRRIERRAFLRAALAFALATVPFGPAVTTSGCGERQPTSATSRRNAIVVAYFDDTMFVRAAAIGGAIPGARAARGVRGGRGGARRADRRAHRVERE